MNINELIERAHSQAKAMGWWDKERNVGEMLMLIVSECGEALEAHRSGKRADMMRFLYTCDVKPSGNTVYEGKFFAEDFVRNIKDTFEDELADIVIRIADTIGGLQALHPEMLLDTDATISMAFDNVGEQLLIVTYLVATHPDNIGVQWTPAAHGLRLHQAAACVFAIAKHHNIDLDRHIDLKLRYNLTRGQKHGKAY